MARKSLQFLAGTLQHTSAQQKIAVSFKFNKYNNFIFVCKSIKRS
jgi:hypothetical protein